MAPRHLLASPKLAVLVFRRCGRSARHPAVCRDDGQAELFLEGSGEGAAHRVRLPTGGGADLADGCALGRCSIRITSACLLFAGARLDPRCFGGGYGGFQFGIARPQAPFSVGDDPVEIGFELTDALPVHVGTRNAQGVVASAATNQSVPSVVISARLKSPSSTFLRAPPLMLSGNQSILPLVCSTAWARIACWAGSVGWWSCFAPSMWWTVM